MATTQDLLKELRRFEQSPQAAGYNLRLSLADVVLRALRTRGWTQKRLAEAADMKEPFITRIIHGNSNCTFEVAGRILHALGVKAEISEAGRAAGIDTRTASTATAVEVTQYAQAKIASTGIPAIRWGQIRSPRLDDIRVTTGGDTDGRSASDRHSPPRHPVG